MYHHQRRQPLMDVAAPSFLMHPFPAPAHSSPANAPHQPLHYAYLDRPADHSRRIPLQSSFIRSSAPRQMQHFSSQVLPSSYRSTFSMDSSSSSGTGSFAQGSSPLGSPYDVSNADMQSTAVSGGQPYPSEAYPHAWPQVAQPSSNQYTDPYAAGSYELPPSASSTSADGNMMQVVKAEESMESYGNSAGGLYLASYADSLQNAASMPDHQNTLPAYSMSQYSPEVVSQQSLNYNYGSEQQSQATNADVASMSPYMLTTTAQLQYPDDEMPRYVNPTQVSPAISPMSPFSQLQELPQDQSCDPRFTMAGGVPTAHGGVSPSDFPDFDADSSGSASGSPALTNITTSAPIPVPSVGGSPQRKRQRAVSFTSSSEDEDLPGTSGGESDQDEDGEGDDDEYVQAQSSPRARRRQLSTSSTSPATSAGSFSMGRRLAPPVPVPNLTKKSRGRRVPTAQQVGNQGGAQKRMYMCKVPGCGKCFARGEHLKRHVRSIHTNEKPHKCPFPGCGKDFSRHDNLGQHMRVHKGFTAPKAGRL
ncbi:hypothetical protein BC628DRAFT_1313060 [Trametes gibbosa]|uniref:C2H2-type domain-containing protein n=1 Tax=Trametes gibbosa TaxID=160864 RepID=A0A6G6FQJ1_9APHY|nr:hypothetical protein BC628DRAFT_1313060 [Trametes gibbosa]QIE48487.1 hypothetical protein [Trametes gibbosa]